MAPEFQHLEKLPLAERLQLVEDLWDSIAAEASSVPVPASHREELGRRLAEYEKDPGRLLTLDDLRERTWDG